MIVDLSTRQLDAYNRADLDAFCACYHPQIEILAADGSLLRRGQDDFRRAYTDLFEKFTDVHATVESRLVLGEHVVELEHWSRTDRRTGSRESGSLLVRYTEADGLIRWAQFLRPAPR